MSGRGCRGRRDGDRAGRCRRSGSSGRSSGGRGRDRRRSGGGGGGGVEGCPSAGGSVVFGALGEVFAGYGWDEGIFCVWGRGSIRGGAGEKRERSGRREEEEEEVVLTGRKRGAKEERTHEGSDR